METIRNYLMTMFAALPNTPQVRRAMDELWEMMEDKYTELIEEGKTENEAIGTVISEFGNLDELAETLGIRDYMPPAVQEDGAAGSGEEGSAGETSADEAFGRKNGGTSPADAGTSAGASVGSTAGEMPDDWADQVQRERARRERWGRRRQDRNTNRDTSRRSRSGQRTQRNRSLYMVSADEAQDFLNAAGLAAYLRGLAVMLFIISPTAVVFLDGVADMGGSFSGLMEFLGVVLLFLCVAAGVALLIFAGNLLKPYKHLKKKQSCLDFAAARHVENVQETIRSSCMMQRTVGIILCIVSVLPAIAVDMIGFTHPLIVRMGPCFLLILVGIGVLMIMLSAGRGGACSQLLKLGGPETMGGSSTRAQREAGYADPRVDRWMSVYWETVTAIYLCWSFLTFRWGTSWLIWPIAGVVKSYIDKRYGRTDDEDPEDDADVEL